jgi:hypothetical protein
MKKIICLWICFLLLQSTYTFANQIVLLEQEIVKHINNFPDGNLNQIMYVKKIIDYMYAFDQVVRKTLLRSKTILCFDC